jgi:hypothetical protein
VAGNFPQVVKELHAKLKKWNSELPQDAGFPKPKDGAGPTSRLVNPIGEQRRQSAFFASRLHNPTTFPFLKP